MSENHDEHAPYASLVDIPERAVATEAATRTDFPEYERYSKNQLIFVIDQYERFVVPTANKQFGAYQDTINILRREIHDQRQQRERMYERYCNAAEAAQALFDVLVNREDDD